ncbi:MmcQ/YjbR family DNA-binding protein [Erysipelothrix piscisicarius]
MYPGVITEGYYMNKVHWISIRMDKDVDEPLIETLINESYELIFKSLTKKIQSEIK